MKVSRKSLLLSAAIAVIACVPPAEAVLVDVLEDNGNSADFAVDEDGRLLLFVDYVNTDPVWFEVTPETGDNPLNFSGLFFNSTDPLVPWNDFHIELEGATFDLQAQGSVLSFTQLDTEEGEVLVDFMSTALWVDFIPPEPDGVIFGDFLDAELDPLVVNPFFINVEPGVTFTIHTNPTVPEPGTLSLLGVGLLAGALRIRRRGKRTSRL